MSDVRSSFRPLEIERKVLRHWRRIGAYDLVRKAGRGRRRWSFIDGPPYATGHIHLGTARNKILKDAFVRFMRMRGYDVRDQPGFDMHGLPIEVKVEKELGITSKGEIEKVGVERFVQECRKWATKNVRTMTEEFEELGIWFDWKNPYLTITNEYIEGAWWAIGEAHRRGLLYEKEKVLPWCWRCEAPLANAELEYVPRADPSVYVRFPIRGREESLLVWTTTPWTLPSNLAIAAHPDLEYSLVQARGKGGEVSRYIVATESLADLQRRGILSEIELERTFSGKSLEGWEYEPLGRGLLPEGLPPLSRWSFRVVLSEHVTPERTGLVHIAPGHGAEDFEIGERYGLPVFSPVGPDGRYTFGEGPLGRLHVKLPRAGERLSEADEEILRILRERGLLVHSGWEEHSYAECWRCHNPIVYRSTRQWFIAVEKIQKGMIRSVRSIEWVPPWAGTARQMDWVKNARDWCISRQRYWGIPLPVWRCTSCSNVRVVDSIRSLHKLAGRLPRRLDLHRPWIDRIEGTCTCGSKMKRVEDVLDVWFDSACATWSSLGFPSRRSEFQRWFPADWICEGLDQTRGWFYTQLAASLASHGRPPYRRVLLHGWVNDAQGRPMSKSLGNIVTPREISQKYGVDSLRLALLGSGAPWDDLSFGEASVQESQRVLSILWNVLSFALSYMELDGFRPDRPSKSKLEKEDLWILSRRDALVEEVTRSFERGEIHVGLRALESFILEDLSRWYIKLIRERVWDEDPSTRPSREGVYRTLREVLLVLSKLLSPMAPFLSEEIYQSLGGSKPTVHLERWPSKAGRRRKGLEREMELVRKVVEASLFARSKASLKLRWPAPRVVVASTPENERVLRRSKPLLERLLNAKEVEITGEEWGGVKTILEIDRGVIGPLFKDRTPAVLEEISRRDPSEVKREVEREGSVRVTLEGKEYSVPAKALKFSWIPPPQVLAAPFEGGCLFLDSTLTPDLRAEGVARDVLRRIQETRKGARLKISDRIEVELLLSDPSVRELLQPHLPWIAREVRAERLEVVEKPQGRRWQATKEWDLEDFHLTVFLSKVPTSSSTNRRGRGRTKGARRRV